ncbi:hypothetical protein PR048_017256 [Dryococelus australis]|uniref:ZAD domain-containing protein n=1 Tax=Dryococelus australis TaxID=614101 RepID=A0ABQ9H903_9NEOP|nr:hypothetical protein PR048_017256 [Dryococelus australis]
MDVSVKAVLGSACNEMLWWQSSLLQDMFQVFEGDGLPAQICDSCCLQLDSSYDFRKRCEHSDMTLRELVVKCVSSDFEVRTETPRRHWPSHPQTFNCHTLYS